VTMTHRVALRARGGMSTVGPGCSTFPLPIANPVKPGEGVSYTKGKSATPLRVGGGAVPYMPMPLFMWDVTSYDVPTIVPLSLHLDVPVTPEMAPIRGTRGLANRGAGAARQLKCTTITSLGRVRAAILDWCENRHIAFHCSWRDKDCRLHGLI
jgi:hypothetical protein